MCDGDTLGFSFVALALSLSLSLALSGSLGFSLAICVSIANATEDWDRIADIVAAPGNPYEKISSYSQCQSFFNICLRRYNSFDVDRRGRFLLHFTFGAGCPHVMAFVSLATDAVFVKDDNRVWELKRESLLGVLRMFININEFVNFEFVSEGGRDLDVKAPWAT